MNLPASRAVRPLLLTAVLALYLTPSSAVSQSPDLSQDASAPAKLSRKQVAAAFESKQKQVPNQPQLAVKILVYPAVAKPVEQRVNESDLWELGEPLNPETVIWSPGQVFFIKVEATKDIYLSLFYIKDGLAPKLFSPDPAYPATFAPIPAGITWISPPIALDHDETPEILDWIAVSADTGLLKPQAVGVDLQVEVAVRAFLRSATEKPETAAHAEARAFASSTPTEQLTERLENVSKVIYGKTKDLPTTKMGYVVPVETDQPSGPEDAALFGYGPEGIAHGLILFNKRVHEDN